MGRVPPTGGGWGYKNVMGLNSYPDECVKITKFLHFARITRSKVRRVFGGRILSVPDDVF